MKKLLTAAACLAFVTLLVHGAAFGQGADTGDRRLDQYLRYMNQEGKADPEGFVRMLSQKHGIPEEEILQARKQHRLEPADLYMASFLAQKSRRRVLDVAAQYKENQGQGWGVMAQNMGIKPGSAEFKQMKSEAKGQVFQMKNQAKARVWNQNRIRNEEGAKTQKGSQNKGQRGQGQGKGRKK
jgi:hypothetical protein